MQKIFDGAEGRDGKVAADVSSANEVESLAVPPSSWRAGLLALLAGGAFVGEPALGEKAIETSRASGTTAAVTLGSASSVSPVRQALLKHVNEVDWSKGVTFEAVLDWLKTQVSPDVTVNVRERALKEAGVSLEEEVTLHLRNTTVGQVLREAFSELFPDGQIRYRAAGNNITVSTQTEFANTMVVQAYDVRDVVFGVPDFGQNAPQISLSSSARSGAQGGGGSGQSVFSESGGQGQGGGQMGEEVSRRGLEEVRDLIKKMIAPETWRRDGEPVETPGRGEIDIFRDGTIVVRAAPEVHEEIVGFFANRS